MVTRHVSAAFFLAFAVSLLTVVNVLQAAGPVPDLPAALEAGEAADLAPGGKWMVSADLECEIIKVTEKAVLVSVTAMHGEAEQGIPMFSKVPYVARMFKNVGVVQVETKVVLSIPKDRIKQIVPIADDVSALHERPQKAVEQQQVLVEVKVLEISLSKMRELGLEFNWAGLGGLVGTTDLGSGRDRAASVILDRNDAALQFLSQLQKEGLAKILAEPTLVTMSGRLASFRSGGEFPVPVLQDDGQETAEYREFGTRVDLVPVCLDNGKLRLEIRPVISELDPSRSVTVGNTKVPGLRVRSIDATAELMPGQTLAVTGLAQTVPAKVGVNGKQEAEEVGWIVLATPTLIDGIPSKTSPASADRQIYPSPQPVRR